MKLERPTYQMRVRKMNSRKEEGDEDKATTQSLARRRAIAMSAKKECDATKRRGRCEQKIFDEKRKYDVGKEKNAIANGARTSKKR